jgi:hypothetical protein
MTKDRLDQHWKKVRRSKANPDHLTHVDLFDEARSGAGNNVYHSPILKIADVSIGLVKSRESPDGDEMTFLHFQGIRRKLGLNSTNSKTIESLTGTPIPRGWVGATIQLYVDPQARYPKGEKGPAIRIRPTAPKGQADASALPDVPPAARERLENEHDERLREPEEDDAR